MEKNRSCAGKSSIYLPFFCSDKTRACCRYIDCVFLYRRLRNHLRMHISFLQIAILLSAITYKPQTQNLRWFLNILLTRQCTNKICPKQQIVVFIQSFFSALKSKNKINILFRFFSWVPLSSRVTCINFWKYLSESTFDYVKNFKLSCGNKFIRATVNAW